MIRRVLTNAMAVSMVPGPQGYKLQPVSIALDNGRIAALASPDALPAGFEAAETEDLDGRLVTPGLIDCHTHLIYGGSRAAEFEMRLNGASYEEVARAGGGIVSTVAQTRAASEDALLETALPRVDRLIAEGVTTVEIKSGYGLDRETELRMLRVARRIGQVRPVAVVTSFLGAHAVPKGSDPDRYIDEICIPALRDAAADGLVDAVDGFCETIAFSPAQIARVFDAAAELGLAVKLHAEQLSDLGGAELVAARGGLSADHVEYLSAEGVAAMARAGTVAVLLPGAFYTLRETQVPPIAALRDAGVAIAVATDSNPGTAPMTSIRLAMNMAATLFRMTPEECLRATTAHAARALGLNDRGRLAPGLRADLAVWDCDQPAELSYRIGDAPLYRRYFKGTPC